MPRNFSERNLRGCSFKGQDLTGADFSYADIRSADFTGANLTCADFTGAKSGLQRRWAMFLVLVSWVLMGLSGFLSAFAGVSLVYLILNADKNYQLAYQIALAGALVLLALTFIFALAFTFAVEFALAGDIAVEFALAGVLAGAMAKNMK